MIIFKQLKKPYILLLILFLTTIKCFSSDLSVKQISVKDGLSDYSVTSICQDTRGYMWFATRNGLNVYNGTEIKSYYTKNSDPNSILSNILGEVGLDNDGNILFLTLRGLGKFDIKKEEFSVVSHADITAFCYYNTTYIAIDNKIYRHDGEAFQIYCELPDEKDEILSLYCTQDGMMIGSSNDGLYRFVADELELILPGIRSIKTFRDSKGREWIGTYDNGIFCIDDDKITNYKTKNNDSRSISSNFVREFCEDKEGGIWIGTSLGLNKFNEHNKTFTRYGVEDELRNASIWSLFCDKDGILWVGSYFGGVKYYNLYNNIYKKYSVSNKESEGLNFPVIGKMYEDNQERIWICTEGGGLNMYDRKSSKFTGYKKTDKAGNVIGQNIKAILHDTVSNSLWLGAYRFGISKLDLETNEFTAYPNKLFNNICDIIHYKEKLIISTDRKVLFLNKETLEIEEIKGLESLINPMDLHIDANQKLWITNDNYGVCVYDFDTAEFEMYKYDKINKTGISQGLINCIVEDNQRQIWLCTSENGIDRYRSETNDFENFNMETSGLSGNCVYGMCDIGNGLLLVVTDKGISILNIENRTCRNYTTQSGLPITTMNTNSTCYTKDGEMFIGGVDGMISFYMNDFIAQDKYTTILPYFLSINGIEIHPRDETGVLSASLSYTDKIELSADQSMFSIKYTMPDYISINHSELEYKLDGFMDNWTLLYGSSVSLTNLNPGDYTLHVRAVENDNIMSQHSLQIKILAPWYTTWLAYVVYILLSSIVLRLVIRIYNKQIRLSESLKYEQQRIQDVESLNNAKLRYFTNISHEFRTPLTIITSQMEEILQLKNIAPSTYKQILSVYRHCMQLKDLISELLDFRKQEQGHLKLKVTKSDIVAFLEATVSLFSEYARKKQIDLVFNKPDEVINVWFDGVQMHKVINNLLSNAIKFTPKGGKITLNISIEGSSVTISVSDTGKGVVSEDIHQIFKRFYQSSNGDIEPYAGTGIGLALTKGIIELHHGTITLESLINKGSTFNIRLYLGRDHFSNDEISDGETLGFMVDNDAEIGTDLLENNELFSINEQTSCNFKMLIVEDNDTLLQMLAHLFSPYYQIIVANNGSVGLERALEEIPDIIISDVMMPEMNGIDLCKQLKTNISTCHIPIVLLTAKAAIEHKLTGLDNGADDYITKPFSVKLLISRCRNLVNNRTVLREKFSSQPLTSTHILATNPNDKIFIDKVMLIIENHIDNDELNINELSKDIGMSRTTIFKKIKAISGCTPFELLAMVRLQKSTIMLTENLELNITEISRKVGFGTPQYFSKCFKDKYSMSPQEYRKAHLAK